MKEQILTYVTAAIASVGGIAGIISIACTIIKVFGGNSVKSRLAAAKIEMDKTMDNGLTAIRDDLQARLNTDITIDVSGKLDKLVQSELATQKQINADLLEQMNVLRQSQAAIIGALTEMKVLATETRKALSERAAELNDVKPVEREERSTVHISLTEPAQVEESNTDPKETSKKVIL